MPLPLRTALLLAAPCAVLAACAGAQPPTPDPPPVPLLQAPDVAWVERTLGSLSLRERIAQMMMPQVGGDYLSTDSPEFDRLAEWVEREGVGGVVVSVGMPLSYAAKLNALQSRARVPLLVGSDMESGPGMRMAGIYTIPRYLPQGGGTDFPPAMALGAAGSDSLAYEVGRVVGREARAVGVHVTFGPVLDVNSNPANPIINTRSFSEDPARVGRLGAAFIRGAHDAGLLTTAKHFPGHGDTETDSHLGLPAIHADRARLERIELPPYRDAIAAGVDGVMTAHIAVTGVEGKDAPPATLSPYFMTELLRDELGFRGLLFTDAMDMGGVRARYGDQEAAIRAVEAGSDVILMPVGLAQSIDAIQDAVQSGRIPAARIDASVRRILEAKSRVGLHRSRMVDLAALGSTVAGRAHIDVARRVADRSLTLARDAGGSVPLPERARRVLSITYAEPGDLVSGVIFDSALAEGGLTLDAARVDARTTDAEFAALAERAAGADAVVVSAYVSPLEHAGALQLRGGVSDFVGHLAKGGPPLVAISFGSPYLLGAFPEVPTYLLAWGGAAVSQRAAANALLGQVAVTGRLPISLPPYFARGEGLQRSPRLTLLPAEPRGGPR